MRFVHWAYQDAAALPSNVRARDGWYVLGGVAVLGGVSLLDKYVSHEVKEGYRGAFATYVDYANELGGPGATLPVVGVFTASLFTRNARFQDAAFTSMQALAYSFVLNQGIKFAVGRVRPEDASNQHHFLPFSGHSSFPSGHANTAFAILTPWALYYPHPVSYALLVAAGGGTAMARISREKHWLTDVLAGGAQGFVTARWLSRRHQRDRARPAAPPRLSLAPMPGPDGVGLTLHATF